MKVLTSSIFKKPAAKLEIGSTQARVMRLSGSMLCMGMIRRISLHDIDYHIRIPISRYHCANRVVAWDKILFNTFRKSKILSRTWNYPRTRRKKPLWYGEGLCRAGFTQAKALFVKNSGPDQPRTRNSWLSFRVCKLRDLH